MLWTILSLVAGFVLMSAAKPALRAMHKSYTIGRPGLWEVLRHDGSKVKLVAHKELEKYHVECYMELGGKAELGRFIRSSMNLSNDQKWSVDYMLPHTRDDGSIEPGVSAPPSRHNYVTVYAYDVIAPPPPPPPPPSISELEEKMLDELYVANPTAFWLKPDWERAEREKVPFWVLDCHPVGSQVDEVEDYAMLWQIAKDRTTVHGRGKFIEKQTIDQPHGNSIYVSPDGYTMELTPAQVAKILEIENALDRGDVIITTPAPYGFTPGRGQAVTNKKKNNNSYC